MNPRWSALLVLAGVLATAEHGIQIQATSPWNDPHGYTPVVITVSAPRDVDLQIAIDSNGASARATIRVPDGRTVRQTVLLPPSQQRWSSFHQLDWSERSGLQGTTAIHHRTTSRCLLVDPQQTVNLPALTSALAAIITLKRSSGSDGVQRVDPADLPDRWQGYPDWLVLVLTPTGDAALDDPQRAALSTWVRAGGTLVITSPDVARAWEKRGVTVIHDVLGAEPRALGAAITQHDHADDWVPEAAPVPGTESVPVKTFVVLALAFALVVGPLNLWWVGRRNARHLFLITTPVVSFITCVVLIAASLLSDGVSVKRHVVQVCHLDHRSQHLVRWSGCSYFAAFSRSALALDVQTKVRLLDPDAYGGSSGYRRNDHTTPLQLDWRQGQALSGTVLPARLNRQWSYIEILRERRRLVVERDGNGFRLTNGLGTPLLGCVWRDEQNHLWSCDRLAAGESAMLTPGLPSPDLTLPLGHGADQGLVIAAPLPPSVTHRIGRDVGLAYDRLRGQPMTFIATLAGPLDPIVGPESIDVEPPTIVAFGQLPLGPGVEAAP